MDWGLGVALATISTLGWAALPQKRTTFRKCTKDWMAGTYLVGKPGSGKTTFLMNMVLDLRKQGVGVIFLDVHDTCRELLQVLPETEKIIYFAPWAKKVAGINALLRFEWNSEERFKLADSGIMVFKRVFKDSWGANIENILYNSILAILEATEESKEEVTLLDALSFLMDEQYRNRTISKLAPSICKKQIASTKWESESVLSAIRKVGTALGHDSLLIFLSQKNSVNLYREMNSGKTILFDFDQAHLGEGTASFLASLVISRIQNLAMLRPRKSKPIVVFADEFHTYVNDSFGTMIEQCRKRNVGLVMAHQSGKAQLSQRLLSAVTEASTMYFLRVKYEDAVNAARECGKKAKKQGWERMNDGTNAFVEGLFGRKIERKATPEMSWEPSDFTLLPNYHAVAIELRSSVPYPATKIKLPPEPELVGAHDKLVEASDAIYAKDRATVLVAIQASFGGDDNTDGIDGRRKR